MASDAAKRIVYVEWLDSRGTDGAWEAVDESGPMPPSRCHSVGFVLEDHKNYITLGMTKSAETGQVMARLSIPKGIITKRIRLKCP